VAVALSATLLKRFIREQFFLWPAREEGAGMHLLFEPRFRIFRLSPGDGGKIVWHSSTGEPAEGSRTFLSMPAWPLVAVALGIVIYATIVFFDPEDWTRRRGLEP
jgi:hypothetical protein